jgi:hypothetical protein
MKAHSKIPALVSVLAILLSAGLIQAKTDRVAVKAFATDGYTVERARDESKNVQTYFIAEGKFYPGNTARSDMEEVAFMDIAQDLAFNLKRQNFFSETNQEKGDLLILVHYGVTDYDSDYMELHAIDSIDDFGFGSVELDDPLFESAFREEFQAQVFDMQSINHGNTEALAVRARLLGMDELFSITATDLQINDLRQMLEEERFFIVLQAFDLPLYREGEKKMLWTTRYSMSARGKRFDQSLAEMNFVAGDFFGQNRLGLNFKRSSDKSDVKIGEVEVIETQTN